MKRTLILLFVLLTGICSCTHENEQTLIFGDDVQIIEDSIEMSSFIIVEKAIQLETCTSSMVGSIHQIIKKNGLFYINSSNSPVKVFTEDGHFVRTIGDLGHANGEYESVLSMDIDENNVYILANRKLVIYSIDGTFLKTHNLDINADAIRVYDDGYLFFVLEDKNVLHTYTKSLVARKQYIPRCQSLRICKQMPFYSVGDDLIFHEGHSNDVAVLNTKSNILTSAKFLDSETCLTIEQEEELLGKGEKANKSSKRIFDGLSSTDNQLIVASMYNQKLVLLVKDFKTNTKKSFLIEGMKNDLTFGSSISFFTSNTYSKDNFITYVSPILLMEMKQKKGDIIAKSPYKDLILPLVDNADNNSNPIIIEYSFKF